MSRECCKRPEDNKIHFTREIRWIQWRFPLNYQCQHLGFVDTNGCFGEQGASSLSTQKLKIKIITLRRDRIPLRAIQILGPDWVSCLDRGSLPKFGEVHKEMDSTYVTANNQTRFTQRDEMWIYPRMMLSKTCGPMRRKWVNNETPCWSCGGAWERYVPQPRRISSPEPS